MSQRTAWQRGRSAIARPNFSRTISPPPKVLGLELINEPWAGDHIHDPVSAAKCWSNTDQILVKYAMYRTLALV